MIDLIFNHANEVVIVRINNRDIRFGNTTFGAKMASIDGLKLDYHGTILEFPDLKDEVDWRKKAIERFKEHVKILDSEDLIAKYIIYELRNKGYTPKLMQKAGHRAVAIK